MHPKYTIKRSSKSALRRTFLLFTAALLLMAAFAVPAGAASTGDYEYLTLPGGGVLITDYRGKDVAVISVPSVLGGKPVTAIGHWAFSDVQTDLKSGYSYTVPREDIEQIILPATLERIEDEAFDGLWSLEEILIPPSVVHLGTGAFQNCYALRTADLPASLEVIGAAAFQSCDIRDLTVPEGVREIGEAAFSQNYELAACTLPASLERIGDGAFSSCPLLKNVIIPESVTEIGTAAFAACGLESFQFPEATAQIAPGVLMSNPGLTEVTIPAGVERIEQNAFSDCPALDKVIYGGSPSDWLNVEITPEGNDALLNASVEYLKEDPPAPDTLPGGITVRDESPLTVEEIRRAYFLSGYTASAASDALTASELLDQFVTPSGTTGGVYRGGIQTGPLAPAATGDMVRFVRGGETVFEATLVIRGDVCGTGIMSLTQLVRLAAAYRDPSLLTGPYFAAGDLTGTGSITLGDLVQEAALLGAAS